LINDIVTIRYQMSSGEHLLLACWLRVHVILTVFSFVCLSVCLSACMLFVGFSFSSI